MNIVKFILEIKARCLKCYSQEIMANWKYESIDYIQIILNEQKMWFLYYHMNSETIFEDLQWLSPFFNPIQEGHFRGCSGIGGRAKRSPLPKICNTYPTMMKLGTVIPYLKKIQKTYESRDTTLSSADMTIFSPEISKFCYIKKYR